MILVVGKVSLCNAQPSPGRTNAIIDHREARGSPRSSMLLSKWTCRCVFSPVSFSHLFNVSCAPKTRLRSTSCFIPMITIILLSMRALDLNLAIFRACELSRISSQTVLIRAVRHGKDYMPSGREVMLNCFDLCLADVLTQDMCPLVRCH